MWVVCVGVGVCVLYVCLACVLCVFGCGCSGVFWCVNA